MQNAADFKDIANHAKQQKMTRPLDTPQRSVNMRTAMPKMVRVAPCLNFVSLFDTCAIAIGRDVQNCLFQQRFVSQTNLLSKLVMSPRQNR